MKPWAHGSEYLEMEYVMAGIEEFLLWLKSAGAPASQVKRFIEAFTGKNRSLEALNAAMFAHYNFRLKSQAADIQKQVEKAIARGDASFFRDFAFFLEKPLRRYSRLKVWLVGINFMQTAWLKSETSTEWMSWPDDLRPKPKPGEQSQVLSGEQLALLYQNEMGDTMELSQIYRACRELGIKTKYPKKPHHRKK